MKHFFRIFFVFFVFTVKESFAQQNYFITVYTQDDGLPALMKGISQDKQGFLWITGAEGLTRFDGHTFRNYTYDPNDSTSLCNNSTLATVSASDSSLYILTSGGVVRYHRESDSFQRIPLYSAAFRALPDNSGYIWLSTANEIVCVNSSTNEVTRYEFPAELKTSDGRTPPDIKIDSRNRIWLYHSINGVYCFETAARKFFQPGLTVHLRELILEFHENSRKEIILTGKDSIFIYNANATLLLRSFPAHYNGNFYNSSLYTDDLLILGLRKGRFGVIDLTNGEEKDISFLKDADKKTTSDYLTSSFVKDKKGNIWVGTLGAGLFRYDPSTSKIENINEKIKAKTNTDLNNVQEVFYDRSGVIWAVFSGGNFVKIESSDFIFNTYMPVAISQSKLNPDLSNVRTFVQLDPGHVLAGSIDGMSVFNTSTRAFEDIKKSGFFPGDFNLKKYAISNLFIDHDRNLWIGKWGEYISVWNLDNNLQYHFNSEQFGLKKEIYVTTRYIYESKSGDMWFCTDAGLFRLQKSDKDFNKFPHIKLTSYLARDSVFNIYNVNQVAFTMLEDSKGRMWIGTGYGLYLFNSAAEKFTRYNNKPGISSSLHADDVRALLEDKYGTLWVGTNGGGLNKYVDSTDSFISFTEKEGLPNNVIYAILDDNQGMLWLSTNKGLCRFDPLTNISKNYSLKDGLQNYEFNTNARLKTTDGKLIFGGISGFNIFHPDSLLQPGSSPPNIVFTGFKIFNKNFPIPGQGITLKHYQNLLSFEYAALSYNRNAENQYAYMMEGIDANWIFSGTRRFATYSNLSPGNYIFRVKAVDSNGLWNEQGVSFPITILPPWWQTWWAYAGAVVLIIGSVLLFVRLRTRNLRKQRAILEQNVEDRTRKLKETQQQLVQQEKLASLGELTAGIAHEIKNPLNFVNNFSELSNEMVDEIKSAKSDDEKQQILDGLKSNLTKINEHGKRADRIIQNMLLHARAGSGEKTLTDINKLCDEYIDLAYHGVRSKHTHFKCAIEKSFAENIPPLNIVQQDISRVLLNILNNAFYAVRDKEDAQVLISTQRKNGFVEIKIKDNGSGIPGNIRKKIFEPFFTTKPTGEGTGLGLSLSYDIIKAHGGEISLEGNHAPGTAFKINLPV